MGETLKLLRLGLQVRALGFLEYAEVVRSYYRRWSFAKVDLALLLFYLFQNPFRLSRRFLQKRGALEVHTYGETPLTSMARISELAAITKDDVVMELGCGRGRVCFWLRLWIGCTVIGVDIQPKFIQKATRIQRFFGIDRLEFRQQDMLDTALEGVSVIYLYGICYDDAFLEQLVNRVANCPPGTRLITVSFAAEEYCKEFQTIDCAEVCFPWGSTDVYVSTLK